jgi:hypothetical protein
MTTAERRLSGVVTQGDGGDAVEPMEDTATTRKRYLARTNKTPESKLPRHEGTAKSYRGGRRLRAAFSPPLTRSHRQAPTSRLRKAR